MSVGLATLLGKYTAALKDHLNQADEGILERAYELGRTAVGGGLGVLDMSAIHHSALRSVIVGDTESGGAAPVERAAEFFAESLSPVEMALRGYREANARLTRLNAELLAAKTTAEELLAAQGRAERIATRFQEAALPAALPEVAGFAFDAYYRPGPHASVLGGDWYDVLRLADGRVVLSIGDVGGSGLGAVIIMAMIRQVIRGVAYVHPDPVMILDAAGKALRSEHPDAYASAFVGVIDPVAMSLTYASAGHPPPLLRKPDGSIAELTYEGVLLGLRIPGADTARRISCEPHSLLVLYTDGLVETDGELLLGERRLRRAIERLQPGTGRAVADSLYHAVLTKDAQDDVAILIIDVERSIFDCSAVAPTVQVSRWLFDAADADAARRARMAFCAGLSGAKASEADVAAAELIFSELVGNVLRYAPGSVEVIVDWTGPAPVLHVRDGGAGFSHAPRLPRYLLAEKGRGLFIVASLTDEFNVTRMEGGGSHARAVISLSHRRLS